MVAGGVNLSAIRPLLLAPAKGIQAMSIKKHLQSLEAMVSEMTKDYDIVQTRSGHYAVTIRSRGRQAKVFAPGTPSDYRSMLNVKAKIRQTIRSFEPLPC
jgi:gas vesicle protein